MAIPITVGSQLWVPCFLLWQELVCFEIFCSFQGMEGILSLSYDNSVFINALSTSPACTSFVSSWPLNRLIWCKDSQCACCLSPGKLRLFLFLCLPYSVCSFSRSNAENYVGLSIFFFLPRTIFRLNSLGKKSRNSVLICTEAIDCATALPVMNDQNLQWLQWCWALMFNWFTIQRMWIVHTH